MGFDLSGRTAFVTGATSGLGRRFAKVLAEAGADVAIAGRRAERLADLKSEIEGLGRKCAAVPLDVTDVSAIPRAFDAVEAALGPVHVLVNNAGMSREGPAAEIAPVDFDAVMGTNLRAPLFLAQAAAPLLKQTRGVIVNITSVVGAAGNAGQANYAAAKAGVVGMTKSLARELGSRNITVNCVAPGFIDTDMTRALSEQQRELLLRQVPLGRLGQRDDVANAVLFLASNLADYITGQVLVVDGGMVM